MLTRTQPVKTPALVVVAFALSGAILPLHAQTVKRVGPFTIDKISENGQFDRCAATFMGDAASGMLRIAYTRNGVYSISVPGVPNSEHRTMFFEFGPKAVEVPSMTDPKGIRAWAEASPAVIDQLKKVRGKIAISYDEGMYRWPIGNTDMRTVIAEVEACTLAAVQSAPRAAAPKMASGAPRIIYPDVAGASQTCVVAVDPATRREKVVVGSALALATHSNRCKGFVLNAGRIKLAGQPNLCVNVGAGAHSGYLYVENCQDTSVRWDAKGSATVAARIRSQGEPFDNMCWSIPKLSDSKAPSPLPVVPTPCQRDGARELKFFIE